MTPAQLIAQHLAALPHPDGTPRQLPGFATQLMPEQMAQQINHAATEIGEAIINLLETNGYTVATETQLAQPEPAPQIANVHCSHCNARVLQFNIVNPNRILTMHHFTTQKCPQQ